MAGDTRKASRRMNKKTFVLNAIHKLRKEDYLGIHAVFSGFNNEFREYYNEDPIAEVDKLAKDNIVVVQPVKGGVMIYDYKEYNESDLAKKKRSKKNTNAALEKILKDNRSK